MLNYDYHFFFLLCAQVETYSMEQKNKKHNTETCKETRCERGRERQTQKAISFQQIQTVSGHKKKRPKQKAAKLNARSGRFLAAEQWSLLSCMQHHIFARIDRAVLMVAGKLFHKDIYKVFIGWTNFQTSSELTKLFKQTCYSHAITRDRSNYSSSSANDVKRSTVKNLIQFARCTALLIHSFIVL